MSDPSQPDPQPDPEPVPTTSHAGTVTDPVPYADVVGTVPGPDGLYVDHAVGDEDPTTGLSTVVWWAPGQKVEVPY